MLRLIRLREMGDRRAWRKAETKALQRYHLAQRQAAPGKRREIVK